MYKIRLTEFICIFHPDVFVVLIIDPQIAGISGDMLLSSLVHIGANKEKILNGVKTIQSFLPESKIKNIDFTQLNKNGIFSTKLVLELDEHFHERKAVEIRDCIEKTVEHIGLSNKAKNFAISSIQSLIDAESRVHGMNPESIHFHEAASIDTAIDIVGVAIALDDLGLFQERIISMPVAVGSGYVDFSHGKTSNPASAILEIFKNSDIMILGGQVKDELCTPTGSSMLVNLVSSNKDYYPPMRITDIGYGAGEKNFKEFSNVLKIVRGIDVSSLTMDSVSILETNLDDVSGEIIGSLIQQLTDLGAKDVTVTNGVTKKGRPTFVLTVICSPERSNLLTDVIFDQGSTLGIRIRQSDRIIKTRTLKSNKISIHGKDFLVRFKESYFQDRIDFKIEFDDIQMISNQLHVSLRESERLITKALFR